MKLEKGLFNNTRPYQTRSHLFDDENLVILCVFLVSLHRGGSGKVMGEEDHTMGIRRGARATVVQIPVQIFGILLSYCFGKQVVRSNKSVLNPFDMIIF